MSTPFVKHTQPDGAVRWWQAVPGRYVDQEQYQLREWLAAGGVPDVRPAPRKPTPEEAKAAELAQAELAAQMERERPATAAELAAIEKRVAAIEAALADGVRLAGEREGGR